MYVPSGLAEDALNDLSNIRLLGRSMDSDTAVDYND